jgi:hypothetical protein
MDGRTQETREVAPIRALRRVLAEPGRRGQAASWILATTMGLIALALVYQFFPHGR